MVGCQAGGRRPGAQQLVLAFVDDLGLPLEVLSHRSIGNPAGALLVDEHALDVAQDTGQGLEVAPHPVEVLG
jgi:hypothetical protein